MDSIMVTKGHNDRVMGVTWALTAVCIIVMGLRLYVRAFVVRALAWDDWFMLPAVILQIVFQVFIGRASDALLHIDPLTGAGLQDVVKNAFSAVIPATLVAILARISASIFLIRVFGTKQWLRWYLIIWTSLQSILGIISIITLWGRVTPVEGLWDPTKVEHERWSRDLNINISIAVAVFLTWSDLTYVLFPTLIIWKLNMPLRRRISLMILMGMSLFTVAASITKAVSTLSVKMAAKPNEGLMWSGVEQTFVIIMGCVPPLMPLARVAHPFIQYLSNLASRIVSRSGSSAGSARTPPASSGFNRNGGYHDMEMPEGEHGKRAPSHKDEAGLTVNEFRGESSHSDLENGGAKHDFEPRRNRFPNAYSRSHENMQQPQENV